MSQAYVLTRVPGFKFLAGEIRDKVHAIEADEKARHKYAMKTTFNEINREKMKFTYDGGFNPKCKIFDGCRTAGHGWTCSQRKMKCGLHLLYFSLKPVPRAELYKNGLAIPKINHDHWFRKKRLCANLHIHK